ncbi:MAG: hypothetical protein ACK4EY_16210 [Flavipsychrobacter sp.]
MKHLLYISFLLLLAACTNTKKLSTSKTETTKDSVSKETVQAQADSTTRKTVVTIKDTAIGVPGETVADTIPKEQTEPPRNKAGKAQKQRFEKKGKGITAFVEIDTNGNFKYGAEKDSQTILVKGITSVSDSTYINNKTSSATATHAQHSADTRVYQTWKKVTNWGGWPYAIIVLFCILFVVVAGWVINKVSKWPL